MIEWITNLIAELVDYTSEWWLKKTADRSEKRHPEWYGGKKNSH